MSEFFSCLLHESGVIGCFFLSTFIRSFVIFGLSGTFFLLFLCIPFHCFFFFFQAEDGIRDRDVTGVQTCALPICSRSMPAPTPRAGSRASSAWPIPRSPRRRPWSTSPRGG